MFRQRKNDHFPPHYIGVTDWVFRENPVGGGRAHKNSAKRDSSGIALQERRKINDFPVKTLQYIKSIALPLTPICEGSPLIYSLLSPFYHPVFRGFDPFLEFFQYHTWIFCQSTFSTIFTVQFSLHLTQSLLSLFQECLNFTLFCKNVYQSTSTVSNIAK